MSLLNEIITELNENAAAGATGAGAIAAVHGKLMSNSQSGMINRTDNQNKKTVKNSIKSFSRGQELKGKKKTKSLFREDWQGRLSEMIEDNENFDAADVESKLNASEKKSRNDQDSVPFGMEDEDGNIVKVYVRSEQADEFEVALANALAGDSDSEDDDIDSAKEIAEVLFALKDKFDIVDVEWPQIEGDEEEETEMAADEAGMETEGGEGEMGEEGEDPFGEEGGEEPEGEDLDDLEGMDDDLGGEMEMEPEGGAEGTLQSVIDMMKSDAEARKADAEARTKEAEARTAEANASSAASKVKQEEQILDMEAHEKNKKSEKGETERLAKLAKYQHEMAAKDNVKAEEEEESAGNDSLIGPDGSADLTKLANFIRQHVQAGGQ